MKHILPALALALLPAVARAQQAPANVPVPTDTLSRAVTSLTAMGSYMGGMAGDTASAIVTELRRAYTAEVAAEGAASKAAQEQAAAATNDAAAKAAGEKAAADAKAKQAATPPPPAKP